MPKMIRSTLASSTDLELRRLLEAQYRSQNLESFRTNQTIPLQPDRLWVVYRGAVALETLLPDGSEAILGFASTGTFFGQVLSAVNPYRASALAPTDLLPLSIDQVQRSPILARNLLFHALRRLDQASDLKSLLTLKRADERLWQLLQLLDREFGQPLGSARRLNLRLTHRQLASAAQTTRVTVTRLLQLFQAQGRIEIDADRHLWFPAGGKNSPDARDL
ncbi:MAG: Crp/Fnr family transcriptional regulator [Limnothrix sp.]|nr:Crp/Fnr family transcriptional regulator [Limnothrix sp.]